MASLPPQPRRVLWNGERFRPREIVTFNDETTEKDPVDDTRGTLENPMNREEVVAKCQDLMEDIFGAAKYKRLIDAVLNAESVKDIRTLQPLL